LRAIRSLFPLRLHVLIVGWLSYRIVRGKLGPLIENWQRICILAERIIKRREAAAVRFPPAYRRIYFPTHFPFALYSSHPSSWASVQSSTSSIFSGSSLMPNFISNIVVSDEQGDLSRLTNTLRTVIELNEHPWRGDDSELDNGVRQGLEHVAEHAQIYSDLSEQRVC
jgi:sorting nexin-8